MTKNPDLFWGMIASMWIGNLLLLVINLPLVGLWVRLLKVPYRLMFPAILMFCCIGIYSINSLPTDIMFIGFFGFVGYVLIKFGYEPAPLLLGFVLGKLMEENLRRALVLSRGDMMIFVEHAVSAGLLAGLGHPPGPCSPAGHAQGSRRGVRRVTTAASRRSPQGSEEHAMTGQEMRIERDAFGEVEVPADRYWGAQTQRALALFEVGEERFPSALIRAFGLQKLAAARANRRLGTLAPRAGGSHRGSGPGGLGGPVRCPLPPDGLADRLRHPDEHECQRGDRQPSQRDARASSWIARADPPERPRQSLAVVERQLSDGDASRDRARTPPPPASGSRSARGDAGHQGGCLQGRR